MAIKSSCHTRKSSDEQLLNYIKIMEKKKYCYCVEIRMKCCCCKHWNLFRKMLFRWKRFNGGKIRKCPKQTQKELKLITRAEFMWQNLSNFRLCKKSCGAKMFFQLRVSQKQRFHRSCEKLFEFKEKVLCCWYTQNGKLSGIKAHVKA